MSEGAPRADANVSERRGPGANRDALTGPNREALTCDGEDEARRRGARDRRPREVYTNEAEEERQRLLADGPMTATCIASAAAKPGATAANGCMVANAGTNSRRGR